jgi:hypothetical protein
MLQCIPQYCMLHDLSSRPTIFKGPVNSVSNGYRVLFLRVQAFGGRVDHVLPLMPRKNVWSFISTLPYVSMALCLSNGTCICTDEAHFSAVYLRYRRQLLYFPVCPGMIFAPYHRGGSETSDFRSPDTARRSAPWRTRCHRKNLSVWRHWHSPVPAGGRRP